MFGVTHAELETHLERMRVHIEERLRERDIDITQRLLDLARNVVKHQQSLEKRMSIESDKLATSIKELQAQAIALKTDNTALLNELVQTRTALAAAVEAGATITPSDLTAAIASIDAVTADLSAQTTTDDAILNPPPVTPAPPAPLPAGQVAPSPAVPAAVAPSAADPAGINGEDESHGSVTAGTKTSDGSAPAVDPAPAQAPAPAAASGGTDQGFGPDHSVDHTDPGSAAPNNGVSDAKVAPGSSSPGAGSTGAGTDPGSPDPGLPAGAVPAAPLGVHGFTDSDGNTIPPKTTDPVTDGIDTGTTKP